MLSALSSSHIWQKKREKKDSGKGNFYICKQFWRWFGNLIFKMLKNGMMRSGDIFLSEVQKGMELTTSQNKDRIWVIAEAETKMWECADSWDMCTQFAPNSNKMWFLKINIQDFHFFQNRTQPKTNPICTKIYLECPNFH